MFAHCWFAIVLVVAFACIMLIINSFIALLVGVSTVLADGAAIEGAISAIQNATSALSDTVGSWDGGLLGSLPIIVDSTSLLNTINKGTATAKQSANLSDVEGFTVGVDTIQLVTDVNSSLTTIIAAKSKFDKILLTPVVLLNLELEKSASADFSDAVISKLPATLVSAGETLSEEIAASFDQAIGVYSGGIL